MSVAGRRILRQGVGETAAALFDASRLVRCFSAVDATCIEQGHGYGEDEPLAVPLAGDDAAAVETVARLVAEIGCVPVVTGDIASSRSFQRGSPVFRAKNRTITWIWTGSVAAIGVAGLAANLLPATGALAVVLDWVVPVAAIVFAIRQTKQIAEAETPIAN